MIPKFPEFKKLELSDKDEINDFVKKHPPYSDYNFVSLWSYNTKDTVSLSRLNDNLVIQFEDYLTNQPFYSFLGTNEVKETIDTLLQYLKQHNLSSQLKLIPEVVVKSLSTNNHAFVIEEDIDNHDYILETDGIIKLKGGKYRGKKNFINRFMRNYPKHQIVILDLKNPQTQKEIYTLFSNWAIKQKKTEKETEIEQKAIRRLLESAIYFNLHALGIYIDNKMIGFSINEVAHSHHGVIHFEKADTTYEGIFSYIKHQTAKHLSEKGCAYINYEQDLGIEGLRKAKKQWHPIGYLKKYSISLK